MRSRIHQETASSNPRRAGRAHYNMAKVLGGTGEREAMLPELDAALACDLDTRIVSISSGSAAASAGMSAITSVLPRITGAPSTLELMRRN